MSRLLVIHGESDYSALVYAQHYEGVKVSEVIDNPGMYPCEDGDCRFEVVEYGDISVEFMPFLRRLINTDMWMMTNVLHEDEILQA
jgi:hypothetical protein